MPLRRGRQAIHIPLAGRRPNRAPSGQHRAYRGHFTRSSQAVTSPRVTYLAGGCPLRRWCWT